MAKIYRFANQNKGKALGYLFGCVLCCVVPLGALIAYNVTQELVWVYLAGIAGAVGLWRFVTWQKQYAILQSGLQGEKELEHILRALPRGTYVLLNPVYVVQGRVAELDAVVVDASGITIVEGKNTAGTLEGAKDAQTWRHTRSGKGGTLIEKRMKNPLLQNERQCTILAQLLTEQNLSCPIKGCVLFTNDYIQVNIKDARIYKNGDTLVRAIERRKEKLSQAQVREIVTILRKQAQ